MDPDDDTETEDLPRMTTMKKGRSTSTELNKMGYAGRLPKGGHKSSEKAPEPRVSTRKVGTR